MKSGNVVARTSALISGIDMVLQDFKKAITRLFYDMINADGIIEDDEITFLEELKRKYGISAEDVARAHQITTAEAIKILKDWKINEECNRSKWIESDDESNESYKYTTDNAFKDIDAISGCDNDRDINEAKLLAALTLCLSTQNGKFIYDAIPIKYREKNLRFARREIIYLSSEPHPEIDEVIRNSRKYIECLLAIYGYEFIYIPSAIEFLSKKASNDLLKPILMFSKPLYIKEEDAADKFVEDIQSITTEAFTKDFLREAQETENLKPSLLIKLKTTTVQEKNDNGEWRPVKYTDFLALPIQGSLEYTARLLPEQILGYTQEIISLVRRQLNEKLYCKGIHQTLIDYIVDKSVSESIESITIKYRGNSKGVYFNGLRDYYVSMQPKEIAIYLLIILLSTRAGGKGLPMFLTPKQATNINEIFKDLYPGRGNESPDVFNALNVQISNIRRKIGGKISVMEMTTYSPTDSDGYYYLKINPDNVKILESASHSDAKPLTDWIKDKGLQEILSQIKA